MQHDHYYEFSADSYFELGVKMGSAFKFEADQLVSRLQSRSELPQLQAIAQQSLQLSKDTFPNQLEQLEGYAQGAGIPFEYLWILCHETDVKASTNAKCTSVVTNNGKLIAHNEDFEANTENRIAVVKKTVKNLTQLELYYYNTLGGNAISINSNGWLQSINSLTASDQNQIGIPRNIYSSWFAETADPELDFQTLTTFKRTSGYNHNLVHLSGQGWNIEASASEQILTKIESPFVHTNHFLTELKSLEQNQNITGTFPRYQFATANIKPEMTILELQTLMSDQSTGPVISLFNERTVARILVDFQNLKVYIWLAREAEKGWLVYNLDFLKS